MSEKKLKNSKKYRQDTRIINVENSETTEQLESQNVNFINYNEQCNSEYDSSDDYYVAMVETFNTFSIALQNITITNGNTDFHLLLDSGSGCTIINMSQIMFNCIEAQWSEKKQVELKSFSNDIVETLATLKTPVRCNDWKFPKTKVTVDAGGFRPILGRYLFDQLGISISRKPCPKNEGKKQLKQLPF